MEKLEAKKNLKENIRTKKETVEVPRNLEETESPDEKIVRLNNEIKEEEDIINSTTNAIDDIEKSLGIDGPDNDIPSLEVNKNKKSKYENILSKISSGFNIVKTAMPGAGIMAGSKVFAAPNIDQNINNKNKSETEKNINTNVEMNKALGGDKAESGDRAPISNWEKFKSKINPKNWGVIDYTASGDFKMAYTKAKTEGQEEFMWNNNRYNTKYSGTPRQEVGRYGINGVTPEDINSPYQVNQYDKLGPEYLPGHIEGGFVSPDSLNLSYRTEHSLNLSEGVANKSVKGYYAMAPQESPEKGSSTYVYGTDKDKILENVSKEKLNDKPYSIIDNNCADRVEKVLDIDTNKTRTLGIANPPVLLNEIKKTYPSLDVTERTIADYVKQIRLASVEEVLNNAEYFLGITNSPELKELRGAIGSRIQLGLKRAGYNLPKSTVKEAGYFDGIVGEETRQALEDWQSKNKK